MYKHIVHVNQQSLSQTVNKSRVVTETVKSIHIRYEAIRDMLCNLHSITGRQAARLI